MQSAIPPQAPKSFALAACGDAGYVKRGLFSAGKGALYRPKMDAHLLKAKGRVELGGGLGAPSLSFLPGWAGRSFTRRRLAKLLICFRPDTSDWLPIQRGLLCPICFF